MTDYTIKGLITTFKRHEEERKERNSSIIKQFIEDFPNEPIPDYMKEDFSFPLALLTICEEIQENNRRIKKLERLVLDNV